MSTPLQRRARAHEQQHRKVEENRLWQLWQRLLRRTSGEARTDPLSPAFPPGVPGRSFDPNAAIEIARRAPDVLTDTPAWREARTHGNDAWLRPVLLLVCMAIDTAPARRADWSVRLRLKEDLLPQCSLMLSLSPASLSLRFYSSDAYTHSLLSPTSERIRRLLHELTGRSIEIDVVNDYFGYA